MGSGDFSCATIKFTWSLPKAMYVVFQWPPLPPPPALNSVGGGWSYVPNKNHLIPQQSSGPPPSPPHRQLRMTGPLSLVSKSGKAACFIHQRFTHAYNKRQGSFFITTVKRLFRKLLDARCILVMHSCC